MNYTTPKPGKAFLRHFVFWAAWFGMNSLSLISTWKEIPKMPLLYNYLSLVVLYYSIYYCAKAYWALLAQPIEEQKSTRLRFKHFFLHRRLLLVPFFILLYITGSWFADRYLFNIHYHDFFLYCDARWTKAAAYVFVAIGFSYFKYYMHHEAKETTTQKAAEIKTIILKDYIIKNHVGKVDTLNELIRRVDGITGR